MWTEKNLRVLRRRRTRLHAERSGACDKESLLAHQMIFTLPLPRYHVNGNMNYNHTQIGYLIIFVSLAVAILFGILLVSAGFNTIILAAMFLILFALASFASLNVVIDNDHLRIKFGYGIVRKSFELKGIATVKAVKNHWYYGWGIRFWFWPRMLIFNISGFDAVEIIMKNGNRYRIGTDEPENLERAIVQAIQR
jgi:hypothetical protein